MRLHHVDKIPNLQCIASIKKVSRKRKTIDSAKMKENPKLHVFLNSDTPNSNLTLELRRFITDLVPEANDLIWDNYNAVALAYSKSEKLLYFT